MPAPAPLLVQPLATPQRCEEALPPFRSTPPRQASMPELPAQVRARYAALGLSQYDALVLSDDLGLSRYYDAVVAAGATLYWSGSRSTFDEAMQQQRQQQQQHGSARRQAGSCALLPNVTCAPRLPCRCTPQACGQLGDGRRQCVGQGAARRLGGAAHGASSACGDDWVRGWAGGGGRRAMERPRGEGCKWASMPWRWADSAVATLACRWVAPQQCP